jgi:hypothetical protein
VDGKIPLRMKTLGQFLIFRMNPQKASSSFEPSSLSTSSDSQKITCHYFSEAVANLSVALEVHFAAGALENAANRRG